MLAVRLHDRRELSVDEIAEPEAPKGHQIVLRNLCVGICGSDLHEYLDGPILATRQPHALTGARLPAVLGHEFSGEVIAVGDEVRAVGPGDRVAVMPLFWCGECGACRNGIPEACQILGAIGFNWPWGGMAEFSVVAEHQVAKLPDAVTDAQGALVEPAAVAIHAVATAGVRLGDSVLVAGAGPIGQLVFLAAVAAGAAIVYLSEPNPARRARAESLGVATLLDPSAEDVVARLQSDGGVDVAIETAGSARAAATCIAAVRPGGTIMQTGLHTSDAPIDLFRLTTKDLTLRGANCFPVASWPRVIRLIASGAMPVERVVTGRVALADAVEGGFDALADPSTDHVKIILEPAR
jgi:(R,R)-butanediol dehydrogenase/meso-butanediol dehydrogenase/diacetyl reductase